MITRSESQFRGRISSILQVFLDAAVTEICEVIDLEVAALRAELSLCRSERGSARVKLHSSKENTPLANEQGLAKGDVERQQDAGRAPPERKMFNQGTPKTLQSCSLWNQQNGNEEPKHDNDEECSGTEAVLVKMEMLDEPEKPGRAPDKQEDLTGRRTSTVNPTEDTKSPPDTRAEWADTDVLGDPMNRSGESMLPNAISTDNRKGCLDRDLECEDLNMWTSAKADKLYSLPAQLPRHTGPPAVQDPSEELVEQSDMRLSHWDSQALSPRNQIHHSVQYEEPTESGSIFRLNPPPSSAPLGMRGELHGGSSGMSFNPLADVDGRFICHMCGKVLRSDRALRSHMKDHTSLHICSHCGKSFARLTNLRVHLNIHMGLKPYNCKFCLKKFSDPSNYNRHKHRCPMSNPSQLSS